MRRRSCGGARSAAGIAVALLVALGSSAAEEPTEAQSVDAPPARPVVSVSADTLATTVGGRINVTLEVDTPPGWFVTLPDKDTDFGAFRLRGLVETERTANHRQLVMTIVALESGDLEIPSLVVQARHGSDTEETEIATDPIPVSVASNLVLPAGSDPSSTAPDVADPSRPPAAPGDASTPGATAPGATAPGANGTGGPITPVDAEPAGMKPALTAPRDWWPLIIAAICAALAAVIGFLVLRHLRNRPPAEEEQAPVIRVPTRPAWEIAIEDLDKIVAAGWVDRGDLQLQYDAVTEALRRYLENRYGVPALECTTDDLRELLRGTSLRGEMASRVLSLLGEADLIKFAKGIPDASNARSSEKRAREIVEATIPAPGVTEVAA